MGKQGVAAVKFTRNRDMRYCTTGTISDGTQGILSMWYRFDEFTNGVGQELFNHPRWNLKWDTTTWDVTLYNAAESSFLQYLANNAVTSDPTTWHHLIMAWDTNFAAGSKKHLIYLDGVSQAGGTTIDNQAAFNINYSSINGIGFSMPGSNLGSGPATVNDWGGGLAEVYFAPNQYLDLTVAANVQKFRTTAGKPANLGPTGSLPTGTSPWLYLKNPAATCGVNSGTGPNFTVVGTPADTFGP